MKHTLIALTALATCAAASAQSSVSMFGVVDASVTRLSSDSASVTGLSSGEQSSSRLGFRGVEDLGGGLQAGFWLEGSLAVDNGGSTYRFDRRSTVSLLGGFGEVRLGRDKLASYLNVESFDPFGDIGVGGNGANNMLGNATAAAGTVEGSHPKRSSNIVSYITPKVAGFHGQIQYSFGERASTEPNNNRGNIVAARVAYQMNPLEIALGYAELNAGTATQEVTYKATNIGASYDFGFVKSMVLIATERGAGRGVNAYTLGIVAPVGQAGEFRVGYTRFNTQNLADADSSKLALGYLHKLSKRTAVYGLLARVSNDSNASRGFAVSSSSIAQPLIAGGDSATGFSIGVRHTF
ncbi:porin [Acidovorax sp. SD340]|uniref:porin n=1 Tax=Acidovorax sp. SD340 TaxID=1690268 RepID=UPI0006DC28BA|nr:porin [Acidovorax sp. SD340]KQB55790.1 porin [Acidovorax sp. SD340]MBO1011695.1 porin [Acidovorax sp. SD340]